MTVLGHTKEGHAYCRGSVAPPKILRRPFRPPCPHSRQNAAVVFCISHQHGQGRCNHCRRCPLCSRR
uniref:Uncharacterized protein n=1 Tax=Panagrellus redivivus TaxID=6233 RepID=A0A7E4ZW06_PANRE